MLNAPTSFVASSDSSVSNKIVAVTNGELFLVYFERSKIRDTGSFKVYQMISGRTAQPPVTVTSESMIILENETAYLTG